ncbi:hypothetical protein HYS54_01850 [Candidatus Micrarchaeota archaeon]|nr:hypothetical protein [Candidatus Micrarchaeota archaeon]
MGAMPRRKKKIRAYSHTELLARAKIRARRQEERRRMRHRLLVMLGYKSAADKAAAKRAMLAARRIPVITHLGAPYGGSAIRWRTLMRSIEKEERKRK